MLLKTRTDWSTFEKRKRICVLKKDPNFTALQILNALDATKEIFSYTRKLGICQNSQHCIRTVPTAT